MKPSLKSGPALLGVSLPSGGSTRVTPHVPAQVRGDFCALANHIADAGCDEMGRMNAATTTFSKNQSKEKCTPLSTNAPLNQWRVAGGVEVELPAGGYERLLAVRPILSPVKLAGCLLVASLLWSSRRQHPKKARHVMRLVEAAARQFVALPQNPATFIARVAWDCELATMGRNFGGKVANEWFLPPWFDGRVTKQKIRLTARQHNRWNNAGAILRACSDEANPHLAIVRQNIRCTERGATFDAAFRKIDKEGQQTAVKNYLESPHDCGVTCDNDIHSNVSRLPKPIRLALSIAGKNVAEFDIKSAHPELLGMFYRDESGAEWLAEQSRFNQESRNGFLSIYGKDKAWKTGFLSGLNQATTAARILSPGYREFERLFPLLAAKIARLKSRDPLCVGRILRVRLAEIQKQLIVENNGDGIPTIPVVDSAIVAMPDDPHGQHRAAFRTAWRLAVPLSELSGTHPLIVGSNGESYRFLL